MRNVLRNLIVFLALLLPTQYAFGADINGAFDSLLGGAGQTGAAVSSAGAFSAGGRTIVTGGAIDIKFPKSKQINMFSLTPPSVSMGCSGISAFFGGFSFINTAQIQELISNIVRGAIGFVAQLAIKTLCPMCEAVLQKMQDLATAGARLNINSCQIGKNLAQSLLNNPKPNTTTGQEENAANKCGQAMMDKDNTTAGDLHGNLYEYCRDIGKAMSSINSFITDKVNLLNSFSSSNPPGSPANLPKLADATEKICGSYALAGNSTWCALSAMRDPTMKSQNDVGIVDTSEYRNRVLIMNMVGTMAPPSSSVSNSTVSSEGTVTIPAAVAADKNAAPLFYSPTMSAEAVYALFMCGNYLAIADSPEIVADCNNIFKEVSLPATAATFTAKVLMNCFPNGGVPSTGQETEALFCREIHMGGNGISLNQLMGVGEGNPTETTFKGFYPMVHELLMDGVKSIRDGTPLYGTWDGTKINISSDPKKARLYALVSASPIPLYKVMNLAAIYPAASREFLKVNAVLLAEMMTQAYMNQILTLTNAMGGGAKVANQAMIDRVHDVMDKMRLLTRRKQEQTTAVFVIQQHLLAQIMQMEKGLQQSVFTAELQTPENFSNAALRAAINGARETPNASTGGR